MTVKKEKRYLPSDWSRKVKYESLDDTPKEIEQSRGKFFDFPEEMKGYQFQDRDFLVFYFDLKEDYEDVLRCFEIPTKAAVSHPELDTDKLVRMVRQFIGKAVKPDDGRADNGEQSKPKCTRRK